MIYLQGTRDSEHTYKFCKIKQHNKWSHKCQTWSVWNCE